MTLTGRKSLTVLATVLALGCGLVFASGSQAAVTGSNPCSGQAQFAWYGNSVGTSQQIPSKTSAVTYPSTVLVPADTTAYPGQRPVVIIQHGRNGDRCSLWWIAQYLAGHGFVAEVHAAPEDPNQEVAFRAAYDASESAIAFMNSPANPAAAVSDMSKLGFMGHSLGSAVTSLIQGDPETGIKAIVAFDNLRRYLEGDPGGTNQECASPPNVEVSPRVPALGMAKDEPCNITPDDTRPENKQFAWQYWRSKGLPSMETVMKGFVHGDFSKGDSPTEEAKHKDLSWYVDAWFTRWLLDDTSQEAKLLSRSVNGRATSEILSSHYLSAACLPGAVDSANFASWISADPVAPSPMAGCQTPVAPSRLAPKPASPATSTTPRVAGVADEGATIEIFRTPDCSGTPTATGTGTAFNGNGIPVKVAAVSTSTFKARATNPVTGLASPCSSDSATYRQAVPVLASLRLKAPRKLRAGKATRLRVSVRNRGVVAATNVKVRFSSSNRKVKVRRLFVVKRIPAGRTVTVGIPVRAARAARGKARIRVSTGKVKRSVKLRLRPRD